MWNKITEWLEQKSYLLMTLFIIIQGLIFTLFTVLFLLEKEDLKYKIYICGSMCLFFIFMVHFAYHSVIKFLIQFVIKNFNLQFI
jgi:hypothetical protein